ncbi:MAG: radical SAM protein [Desulfobacteraceae bacterium 4572_130]|nr:MAG: radical SAM protein [Desulfobacteraceae bacterium 4572_130]
MYKYLFGPVPSRRLGISLGVDLVTHKICSLNCIYCECGKTTNLTLNRKQYVPFNKVIKELDHYFQNNPDPDYITFSGSGEPCLNVEIGEVINYIKKTRKHILIAVLTNGTLLSQKQVRNELLNADTVIFSLDAASDLAFQKINRPCQQINLKHYIQGLFDFTKEYKNKAVLEYFVLPDINDSKKEVMFLKHAFEKIKPDIIQLNTLDRPGSVSGIKPVNLSKLKQIVNLLEPLNVEIIAGFSEQKKNKLYRQDMESAIIETIHRRPCTSHDLEKILGKNINEINKCLKSLQKANKIKSMLQKRGLFFQTNKD